MQAADPPAGELDRHLAELEDRRLHLEDGYPSICAYCHDQLGLTDAEAYLRIATARIGRRYPVVLALLAEGAINMTTVKLLSPLLTAENHAALLAEARGKRKHEVETIVARLAPRPDVPTSVRKLPERQPVAAPASAETTTAVSPARPAALPTRTAPPTPIAPERYALHTTIDREVRDLMDLARDLGKPRESHRRHERAAEGGVRRTRRETAPGQASRHEALRGARDGQGLTPHPGGGPTGGVRAGRRPLSFPQP